LIRRQLEGSFARAASNEERHARGNSRSRRRPGSRIARRSNGASRGFDFMTVAPEADPTRAWDYIVIGAGTAGGILAHRLSADGKSKVLVIEAGGEDNKLRYKLVAMSTECMNNPE